MPKTTFGSFVMSEKNLKRRSDGFADLFRRSILFRVELETKRVVIYRVYHGSRVALAEGDLP